MNLNNVTLNVYKSSVAEEYVEMTGNFTLTNITRNGRTQVIETSTNVKYWVINEEVALFNNVEAITEETLPEEELFEDVIEKEDIPSDTPPSLDDNEGNVPNSEVENDEIVEDNYFNILPSDEEKVAKEVPPVIHIVKRGETISSIANKYGLSAYDIIRMAGVEKPAVGQRIVITK